MKKSSYECITFDVEKDISKPNTISLKNSSINNILSSTFKRAKPNTSGLLNRHRISFTDAEENNESMEILNYNFDTEKTSFFNNGKKSLIHGLMVAYGNHYPITISPDMILLLFLQGYAKFMEKNSEKLRNIYVNFKGQKTLTVVRNGVTPETAKPEIWEGIITEFTQKIKENVGNEIISYLESDFTTTNPATLATSQMTIMSAMKNYFKYEAIMMVCGISSINLEGTLEDWEKIKKKLEFFSKNEFGLNWWTKHLIPIIDKIIETKICYNKNKDIDENLRKFWKDIIRVKRGGVYQPDVIDGWIVKFLPNISEERINEKLNDPDIPDQVLNCPLKLIFSNGIKKIEYDCSLASGFYGVIEDENNFGIKPVIGYSIVVEDKKIN